MFDWNASFEWLAQKFYEETGLVAPGKNDPLCESEEKMKTRINAYSQWIGPISEHAWREWHEKHGMLKKNSTQMLGISRYLYPNSRTGWDWLVGKEIEAIVHCQDEEYGQCQRLLFTDGGQMEILGADRCWIFCKSRPDKEAPE